MCLFIDCHFLFEVQLLCLSLDIEVLSSEDGEWSRGRYKNGVPNGEIGIFPTYSSLARAQPFLSFPYVSIKNPFPVTSYYQDRNGRCCSRVNR